MNKLPLVKYPAEWGFKRTPARDKELWVYNFEENYDWDNLWYDAIQVSQNTILLIGPPLYGTGSFIYSNCYFTDNSEQKLEYRINEMDRMCITVVTVSNWTGRITLVTNNHKLHIPVTKQSYEFHNKKVIVTISKNHPITWLQQWIDYHKEVHNIDGVIIYNNQSTIYSNEELQEQLSREDVLVEIVDYNVPFGCMGGGIWQWGDKSGTSLPWDSDFSQYIMLEHAKWKYLHCAKLVVNADTDELLLLKNTTLDDIADRCNNESNSAWKYNGIWIEPVSSITRTIADVIPNEQRRFDDYWHTANNQHRGVSVKWMLAPKHNMNNQWHLHNILGHHMVTDEISFAHYLPMNTGWSYQRDKFNDNVSTLVELPLLKQSLDTWKHK
jgi:hypothetical protein